MADSMDTINVSADEQTITVDLVEDVIWVNPPSGGIDDHSVLLNRGANDQHPISSITGLEHEMDDLNALHGTSWLSGGVLSINADNTKFNLTAGEGMHVDHSTVVPVITHVSWLEQLAIPVTNISSQTITEIGIDKNGNVIQQLNYTSEERRDIFTVGTLVHADLATVQSTPDWARAISRELVLTIMDFALALGTFVIDGGKFTPDGATLKFSVSAGIFFAIGANRVNAKDPNRLHSDALTTPPFLYTWKDGSGGFTIAPATEVNPGRYDDGTGGAGQPNGTVQSNKWTLLRVYYVPRASGEVGPIVLHYGTETFLTANDALLGIEDAFIVNPVLVNAVHRADIAVLGAATDLSVITDAVFNNLGKFA